MRKLEFKRLFYDKSTVISILIIVCLGMVSIYFSQAEKLNFINTLNQNYEDIDASRLLAVIESYNGMLYMLNFMYGDFGQIALLAQFLLVGIFYSPRIFEFIENGYENLIVVRTTYESHLKTLVYVQSKIIFLITFISYLLILALSFFIGGFATSFVIYGNFEIGVIMFIFVVLFQVSIISLLLILSNSITVFLSYKIKQKRLIQLTPILLFFLFPMILSSIFTKVFPPLAMVFNILIPWQVQSMVYQLSHENMKMLTFLTTLISLLIYFLLKKFWKRCNLKYYGENLI